MSLAFQFRIGLSTVSKIIPETCEAIYKVLQEKYLKVCVHINSLLFDRIIGNAASQKLILHLKSMSRLLKVAIIVNIKQT